MDPYRALAKPLFFALPPEAAHRLAHRLLGMPFPWERIGRPDTDPSLRTTLAGIPLANPLGLAAGFDKTGERVRPLGRLGFGYVVAGTFTKAPRSGNPKPRIVRDVGRLSIVNAMGLPNPGAAAAAAALARTPSAGPRFASIADEAVPDAVGAHRLLEPHVDAIELNASCPNVSWGRDRDNEHHLRELLEELARVRAKPLFVKLPPFRTPIERDVVLALARISLAARVDGLTCSNTLRVREPRLSTGEGGLSGRALASDTPRIVHEVVEATEGALPVNACGGVVSPADAQACLDAGATTVQVYTGLIYRGPGIVGELTAGLARRASVGRVVAR